MRSQVGKNATDVTQPTNLSVPTAPELVGGVVEARIYDVIKHANGSRVVYAIVDLDADLTSAIGMAVATIPLGKGEKIEGGNTSRLGS